MPVGRDNRGDIYIIPLGINDWRELGKRRDGSIEQGLIDSGLEAVVNAQREATKCAQKRPKPPVISDENKPNE
jgi:hypothetical protein